MLASERVRGCYRKGSPVIDVKKINRMTNNLKVTPQVMIGKYWPGVGKLVDVRVKIDGEYCYTTRILKKNQTVVDLVRETRREFKRLAR